MTSDSRFERALPPLPRSLRGTEPDGALAMDEQGRFLPTRDALWLFDYFLSARGEEPIQIIRARIEAEIDAWLTGEARPQARLLLDRYLGYLRSARELEAAGAVPYDLERRLQWVRELRREHFGEALAEDLFGVEEQATRVALEQRRVLQDPALSLEEVGEYLLALEERMPEPYREARSRASVPLRLRGETEALREGGASGREIRVLRESSLDEAAAGRLAALDAQRREWRRRCEAYRAEREAILGDRALSARQREEALAHLLDARFSSSEQLRLRALERRERRQRARLEEGTLD